MIRLIRGEPAAAAAKSTPSDKFIHRLYSEFDLTWEVRPVDQSIGGALANFSKDMHGVVFVADTATRKGHVFNVVAIDDRGPVIIDGQFDVVTVWVPRTALLHEPRARPGWLGEAGCNDASTPSGWPDDSAVGVRRVPVPRPR